MTIDLTVDNCNTIRIQTEYPSPGEGLCLAGVGFNVLDLALYKNMPKERRWIVETMLADQQSDNQS